jgi:cytochrome b561
LFDVLLALATMHIVAALKHEFFDHDGVLRRMLPWGSK